MTAAVFIDGEVGTTGLQIRERLIGRQDIRLIQIDPARRKDPEARREAFAQADVAILCLPDEAAKEAAALSQGMKVRLIDASTAHRVDPDWVFGFAELNAGQREKIRTARYVSNPGCWSTGAIALLAPLVAAGLVRSDAAISINGVSGYSGGGKALIAEFEAGEAGSQFIYGLDHKHKHLPEIAKHAGLDRRPIFIPSVGKFAQGMIVQIPLHLDAGQSPAAFEEALRAHYDAQSFVKVVAPAALGARANPERLNGSNRLELSVHPAADGAALVLLATLDNLGKGASGAAVQNLNIMLDLPEAAGL